MGLSTSNVLLQLRGGRVGVLDRVLLGLVVCGLRNLVSIVVLAVDGLPDLNVRINMGYTLFN